MPTERLLHWSLQEAVMSYHSLTSCPTLPSPLPTGAQCQLRGRSFCAGIPVQSARWDGPCDGASATRPHAAVRRQGEHRALYGTLPLNHAHSLCLSDTLLPSLAFIVLGELTHWLLSVLHGVKSFCLIFWRLSLSTADLSSTWKEENRTGSRSVDVTRGTLFWVVKQRQLTETEPVLINMCLFIMSEENLILLLLCIFIDYWELTCHKFAQYIMHQHTVFCSTSWFLQINTFVHWFES